MRIYVIDDEPTVLMASEQIIRRALPDAEVTAFLSAAKALETLNNTSEPLDVCFCDIEMPGINGLEFALRLKQISPETKIIFVTAYSEYALEAFRIHANGYILKPMNAVRVLEEIGAPAADPHEAGRDPADGADTGPAGRPPGGPCRAPSWRSAPPRSRPSSWR